MPRSMLRPLPLCSVVSILPRRECGISVSLSSYTPPLQYARWRTLRRVVPLQHHPLRQLSYVTNAANFEVEVLQSQQAICLVYYIRNSSCSAYLKSAEQLVDVINEQVGGVDTLRSESTPSTLSEGAAPEPKKVEWLKLCSINADENRNLASAFSVERAKLPITYFIMQGTIVDKVAGHIGEARLHSILVKFLEHYQKEMNVDLLARSSNPKRGGTGDGDSANPTASPLPSAATADLLSGTSTTFLQDKIMNALVGTDMIQLPEEAEKLDGLRRTLQEAKKKAYAELRELHKQLGLEVRRLTDAEMQAHYYNAPQFHAFGVLCALEALYLARSHATLGDVARANVDWAYRGVQKDFEAIRGDPALRRVLMLVEVNLVRAELRTEAMLAAQDVNRLRACLAVTDAEDGHRDPHRTALQEMETIIEGQSQYCQEMLDVIDTHVDGRSLEGSDFPSAVVDKLFDLLKSSLKQSRSRLTLPSSSTLPSAIQNVESGEQDDLLKGVVDGTVLDTTAKKVLTARKRVPQIRTLIMAILQVYLTHPKSQAARARLASLVL